MSMEAMPSVEDLVQQARTDNATMLDLSNRNLTELPASLAEVQSLTYLNVSWNDLSLPEWLGQLTNLTALSVDGNRLASLPEWLAQLTNLTYLNVHANRLASLPEWMAQLTNLTHFDLRDNVFDIIPDVVYQMKSLRQLYFGNWPIDFLLRGNMITKVPPDILALDALEVFDVSENPVKTPPIDVVEGGIEAIRRYYRQRLEEGTDYAYEAKPLIVGEPEAGKTTRAKEIVDPDYQLNPKE